MSADGHHQHHVLGGHKAAIANARVGPEAKIHSVGVLNEADIDVRVSHGHASFDPPTFHEADKKTKVESTPEEEHRKRVLAGYKATLSNAATSEEAKQHAREELKKAGEEF